MTHQKNYCSCGKPIHWPKTATVGSTYKCFRCGTITRMVSSGGQRGKIVRSKPHRNRPAKNISYRNNAASNRSGRRRVRSHGTKNKNSDMCFIATAVYGDVNCDNVKILRKFRDNFLAKYHLGRIFIRFYYLFSPKVSPMIERSKYLKYIIRIIIDALVKVARYVISNSITKKDRGVDGE